MRVRVAEVDPKAEALLPSAEPDGSGVGVNYVDAYVKPIKATLEDGRKVKCSRRGLKLTLKVGDRSGEGLLRRLEHGPDVKEMLRHALDEAGRSIGASIVEEDGTIYLELDEG